LAEVVAPTVQTWDSPAGEVLAALVLLLPAATARKTPAAIMARAALLMAVEVAPPRDMLATAPLGQLRVAESDVTKFMPATTPDVVPEPEASSTLTAYREVFLATP